MKSVETEVLGHRRTVPFYGKVVAVDVNQSLIQLHYLQKRPHRDVCVWSETAGASVQQVMKKLAPPSLAPGRGVAFLFY